MISSAPTTCALVSVLIVGLHSLAALFHALPGRATLLLALLPCLNPLSAGPLSPVDVVYRMAYPLTANEIRAANTSTDGAKVFAGVVIGLGVSYGLFSLLNSRGELSRLFVLMRMPAPRASPGAPWQQYVQRRTCNRAGLLGTCSAPGCSTPPDALVSTPFRPSPAAAGKTPKTFTDEWKAAEKEKAKAISANPVFGMSSK